MTGGLDDKDAEVLHNDRGQPDDNLDDFATLADSYLLSDPGLASELAAVEDALHGPLAKMPAVGSRGPSLDPFAWDTSTADFRSTSMGNWETGDIRMMIHKARGEIGDNNEWRNAREHTVGPLGNGKSDSPNSAHMSASSTALQTLRPSAMEMRVQSSAEPSNRAESSFTARVHGSDMSQLAYEAEKQNLPHSFSRLRSEHPGNGYEPGAQRPSNYTSPTCPPSVFASPHLPLPGVPSMWANDMQDGPNWVRTRGPRMGGHPYNSPEGGVDVLEYSPPDRRHSMGNMPEEPGAAGHHMHSRAASSVDDILGAKVDQSPRIKSGSKQYMPQLSPLFSPQQPSTPSEAFSSERKRKRLADGLVPPGHAAQGLQGQAKSVQGAGPPPSHISSSSSPTAHDDLVRMLKSQIDGIDSHTKAIMKDTLYRISRNTNSENGGISTSRPRLSSRNQYLDKLVANFLYNRFENGDSRSGPYPGSYPGGFNERGYRVSSLESIKPLIP